MKPLKKKMKKVETRAGKAKQAIVEKIARNAFPKHEIRHCGYTAPKMSKAKIEKMQKAQQEALKKLVKKVEAILLVMSPKSAFAFVSLTKDAGIFDLFVALGTRTKLLSHLKKGKK